jgi:outer membrane protein OmpA-like peptidoglycan-associated protein
MLDQLELQQVQRIEAGQDQVLEAHRVPGLETDFLQRLGRRAAAVELDGVISGADAASALKGVRDKFRAGEPVAFVADIAAATRVQQVLVERMRVRELAGRPQRFEYAIRIRELIAPPAVDTEAPPPEPPPEPPDADIVADVGTLVVQVSSGDAGFVDLKSATLTVAPLPLGRAPARTLSGREANAWTERGVAAGEHLVEATVAAPVVASGSAPVTVRAGQTSQVSITLDKAVVVAEQFVVHFTTDKAFVEPCMRRVLADAVGHARKHPSQKLLVIGHTDRTGLDAENQSLSERRARAVFAMLTRGRAEAAAQAEWELLFAKRPPGQAPSMSDSWGLREAQHMLQDLGFYPGGIDGEDGPLTRDAVRAFRCREGLPPGTTIDDDVWRALIRAYLAQDAFAIPASQLLINCPPDQTLNWLGCGVQDPVLNTPKAWRPNRRVELLFLNASALPSGAAKPPCDVPKPDTFDLPKPGARWCLDDSKSAKDRSCFLVKATQPCSAATLTRFCRPAAATTFEVTGTIEREVRDKANGSVTLVPFPGARFAVYDPTGRIDASEDARGRAVARKAEQEKEKEGTFSIPDRPPGIYVFELLEKPARVVRLKDTPDAPATGATVCKSILLSPGKPPDKLDVVVLATTATREIVLPTAVHVLTAIDTTTTPHTILACPDPAGGLPREQAAHLTDAQIRATFAGANQIWEQGRIRADVRDIVRETFRLPARPSCELDQGDIRTLLKNCAYDGVLNVFFVGELAARSEAGDATSVEDATVRGESSGCLVGERLSDAQGVRTNLSNAERDQVLAHELGHYLTLGHAVDAGRLMQIPTPGATSQLLVESEVTGARASAGAALECRPLKLKVDGAERMGGSLSHEFIAVQSAAAAAVTVDVEVPATIADLGTVTTTVNGAPAVDPLHVTVSRAGKGSSEVKSTFTPTAGGPPTSARVNILVVSFDLIVKGALQSGAPGTFIVEPHPTAVVTITAELDPQPFGVPEGLVEWKRGTQALDPLQRTISRADSRSTTVTATLARVTLTRTIDVVELALVANAPPFAPVPHVLIEGILNPDLKAFTVTKLIASQQGSLVRARVRGSSITTSPITATIRSLNAAGLDIDAPPTPPLTITLKRTASGTFESAPILAVPMAIQPDEISLAEPKTLETVRAVAGGKLRVESASLPGFRTEIPVRGPVLSLFMRSLKSSTTNASSGMEVKDLNARVALANRILAQAGIEVKARSTLALVPAPDELLDVQSSREDDPLTDDEQRLLGLKQPPNPADPAPSGIKSAIDVIYVETISSVTLPGEIEKETGGFSFPRVPVIVIASRGRPGRPQPRPEVLAHEVCHRLFVSWGPPDPPPGAPREHGDLAGKPWAKNNLMHAVDAGGTDLHPTQVEHILRFAKFGVTPVKVLP